MDLHQFGAEVVIDLSLDGDIVPSRIREITTGKGISAIIDAVGGPLLADLVRSASFRAKLIIYGGLGEQRFELHNNEVYLNGLSVESYIYRHFFTPPAPEESATLRDIREARQVGECSYFNLEVQCVAFPAEIRQSRIEMLSHLCPSIAILP